jgi:hypothetical protein
LAVKNHDYIKSIYEKHPRTGGLFLIFSSYFMTSFPMDSGCVCCLIREDRPRSLRPACAQMTREFWHDAGRLRKRNAGAAEAAALHQEVEV